MTTEMVALVEREIAKSWYRPRSPLLASLYDERRGPSRRHYARWMLPTLAVFYASIALLDLIFIPDVFVYSVVVRFLIGPLLVIMALGLMSWKSDATTVDGLSDGVVAAAAGLWCILLCLSHQEAGARTFFFLSPTFFPVINALNNGNFRSAFLSSMIVFLMLCAMIVSMRSGGFQFVVIGVALNFWTCGLTLVANWRSGKEKYAVFLQTIENESQKAVIEDQNAELLRLSTTDALTGLANRRAIDTRLQSAWGTWTTHGEPFAVVLIDIDFFKQFNDVYGHQVGDACLARVANAMRATMAADDFIGRFGGEEFAALIRAPSLGVALGTAEAMRRIVDGLAIVHRNRPDSIGHVTVSVGVAFIESVEDSSVDSLVGAADRALYRAKATGRNNVCGFNRGDFASIPQPSMYPSESATLRGEASGHHVLLAETNAASA